MSNITSITSDLKPFLNSEIPINVHSFENFSLSLPKKLTFLPIGAWAGHFCSDALMKGGKITVGKILNAVTNIRSEQVERRIGFTLGALSWASLIENHIKGVSPLLNSFGLAMKMGAAFSALKAASKESNDLEPESDNYTFAVELGVVAGSLVIVTLRSNDISFALSLAAGALTANRITELYCRINARLA